MSRLSAVVAPLLALVAALLLTALSSSAQGAAGAQPKPTAIGVRVVNEAGHLVPGATVALFAADGTKVAVRHTNLDGRCLFAPVPPGDYLVRAHKLGQGKGQATVTAVDGQLTKVSVHLKKQ